MTLHHHLLAWTLAAFGLAGVRAAAEPTPRVTPAPEERLQSLTEQVRLLGERLRFSLGAGAYLFYYQPLSPDTTLAGGSADGTFQVFFYFLKLRAETRGLGAHAEVRLRDGGHLGPDTGNTYFRGFYSSNIWFEQIYAYYTPAPALTLKAGKIYRQFGNFWDDSFFGNIAFYDGLKLNPDYGLSAEGTYPAGGRLSLTYAAQYFLHSDGINGGLDAGRTLPAPATPAAAVIGENDEATLTWLRHQSPNPEGQRDSGGALVGALRHIFVGRLALSLKAGRHVSLTAGGSAQTAQVRRVSARDRFSDEARATQVGADLNITAGPATIYGEYLRQLGPGARDADYVLTGVRGAIGKLALRVNAGYVRYHLSPDVEEFMIQPGLSYTIGHGLTAILEFNEWRRAGAGPQRLSEEFTIYDRSLNVVIGYTY